MSSIEAQLKLEQTMIDKGIANYESSLAQAQEAGRGSETGYARRLMQEFLVPLVAKLEEFTGARGPSARGRARGLLRRIAADKAMLLTLKQVFNSFTLSVPVITVASKVGKMIEDDIRFARFQEMHEGYYNEIIQDFKRKGTKDYRYMQRVLTHSANTHKDQWVDWTAKERVDVGVRLLDIVLTETNLIEKVVIKNRIKDDVSLQPTPEAEEWIKSHSELASLMFPDKMPCIIKPDPWVSLDQGGYYSPAMRQATPMVKVSVPEQRKLMNSFDLTEVQTALNKVQDVGWTVNSEVLETAKLVWEKNLSIGMPPSEKLVPSPMPINKRKEDMNDKEMALFNDWKKEASDVYTKEKERVSKCFQVSRIIRMASQYRSYDNFWYVWYADFRGRLYSATAGFSPQGPDLAKGLLKFSTGKALGERGLYWLKVHGANRYGYDKVDYNARAKWVEDQHDKLLLAANDPLSYRDVWSGADKPWQFLAFMFEYRDAHKLADPKTYVSHLPIGLDGSCNGLQNFSAMLRDQRGGLATNLVANGLNKPSDIYAEVAAVCYSSINALRGTDPMADLWLSYCDKYGEGKIPRKLAKRPVMTMPYGSTRQSCTSYIFQSILDNTRDHFPDGNFAAAIWLTPYLWSAIGKVVVAARSGMDWLQKCAGVMSKVGKPIVWVTSDGFPVVQFSKVINTVQVDTQLGGRFQIKVGTISNVIDPYRQRSGVAPNFVHSQDAAHLRRTVRLATQYGIHDIACIHDDYGTHACDTDLLQRIIRASFVLEYRDRCPLEAFAKTQTNAGGVLPPIPERGTLDLNQVIHSPYFFG